MALAFINIGHLHPLLVHLPVGILVLLFVLEVLLRNHTSDDTKKVLNYTLLIALISSFLSLITGWNLGAEGGYEGALLKLHKWTAVALTAAVSVLWIVKFFGKSRLNKLYWFLLISTLILLTITGHYGASMTHGENFVFEHKEAVIVEISDVNEALVYQDIIRPIFENHCTSCHNTGKANGALIMSSKDYLLKGGKSGDFFSEKGEASALQRIHLPLEEEKHMPPNGKLQLSEEQVFYLEWWFENENCFDCKVSDLEPSKREFEILRKLEVDNSSAATLERELSFYSGDWLREMHDAGISAQPLDERSKLVSINLSSKKEITNEDLDLISEDAENVVELSLANTNFSDENSRVLSEFENLIKLQLQNTSISDETVKKLKDLDNLESLNLYGTSVSAKSLEVLKSLPSLKSVYVWQTEISDQELTSFKTENSEIDIIGQFTSTLLAESKLESPEIRFSKTLFYDTVRVSLSTDFDDAEIYYTLDGTRPDTTSMLFTSAVIIQRSSILTAVCYKTDWGTSNPSSATFKEITTPITSAKLVGKLHENYQSIGDKAINDGVLGTMDFKDGNWLGFQGESPSFILTVPSDKELSNVSVSVMSAQPSWIFYPKGFSVFTSNNKTNWEKVHYSSYASVKQQPEPEKQFFDLRFEPVKTKYLKVELESPLKNPNWHQSPGEPCYIFVDEIIVE